jgi:hypothetical protein
LKIKCIASDSLLLALAIVACVFWLEKRLGHNRVGIQKTDALMMLAQEMNTGENFRIRGKIFLSSTPVVETAKSGESPVGCSLGRRSTGLLSRYGKIQQE